MTNLSLPASDDQSGFNTSGTGIDRLQRRRLRLDADRDRCPAADRRRAGPLPVPTDPDAGGRVSCSTTSRSTGQSLDGAETDTGWTFDGFSRIDNGTET